jgi:transcriptional regulator with PAS, ATPase and Fis domain
MRQIFELARKIIASDATTVLITGDTGTGKELLARAIHHHSSRSRGAFIEVNCSAIPDTLLESELFGYEQGAFTDARGRKRGLFELASGGTLFLDEIGYMSTNLQVKLLRAIEEKNIRRVGGTKDTDVDIRVIAATNRDLGHALHDGSFREDLYYRLNVIAIHIPPLRDRGEDILLLAKHFIDKFCSEHNKEPRILSPEAVEFLMSRRWPGNVRELKNAIERAVVLGEERVIGPDDIKITVRQVASIAAPEAQNGTKIILNVPEHGLPFDEVERRVIAEVLSLTNWNKSKAARLLHIPRPRLLRKIAKYELRPS